ncbi:MAG: MFS transporter, partial [Chloroflexota bacterium]|nr:MFS transporter [Chloroflexota bacterium]
MPRATALLPDLSPLRRHRSFRLLWFGQLVSQGGTQVRLVALPYQIYLLTGSSLHVGLIGLFQAIPLLALTLFGGVIADRVDRGRLLVATQTGLMMTSLALALVTQFGWTELWFLYALTALAAGFSAIDQPSRGALVPTLVDREDLPAAIALNQMLYQSAA